MVKEQPLEGTILQAYFRGLLMSILDLIGKAGYSKLMSPATQARNKMATPVMSPATQARNKMATASVNKVAMTKSRQVVDQLITKGQIPIERREEVMRRLMAEIAENLKNASTPYISNQDLAKILAGLGLGGAVGYGIGSSAEDKALQQMEEETQVGPVRGYFKDIGFGEEEGNWGEPTAKLLMDIISPIPRQK